MYLMMPVIFTLLTRYPKLRPYCGPVGLFITIGALILSSFATEIWQLIATQGVLCAIGSSLLFSPTSLYLDEWFIERKGMAYGTIWAGKSAGGVAFPFIMSPLLAKFSARTVLQGWSVALLLLTAPLLFFLKPRTPLSNIEAQRALSWSFLKHPTFWMLQLGNIIQSLGYLLPTTYLSSYAHLLGYPAITGAVLIAAFSMASVPGGIFIGVLNDRISPTTTILISSLGSTLSVLLFWGLSTNVTLLVIFALGYGFFAGGFSSTYPGVLKEIKREDDGVNTGLVMGLLLGGRGLGYMAGGPFSDGLLKAAWSQEGKFGFDTLYGPVIITTGATALLSGWGWLWTMVRGR
jgi:MFS family permease